MANGKQKYNFQVLIQKVDRIYDTLFGNEKMIGFCERMRSIENKIKFFIPSNLLALLQVVMLALTIYFIIKRGGK